MPWFAGFGSRVYVSAFIDTLSGRSERQSIEESKSKRGTVGQGFERPACRYLGKILMLDVP